MKDLVEKYILRLISLVFILTFTINLIVSFKEKHQAQNEFMENSLGFLFYQTEKEGKEILEEFISYNKNYRIIYLDEDNNIIYRSSPNFSLEDIKTINDGKARKIDYYIKDSLNTGYILTRDRTLLIKSSNKISDFISLRLISIYLVAYFLSLGLVRLILIKRVDSYIKGLGRFNEFYNYRIIDPKYEDIKPYFKNLANKNKKLKEESLRLKDSLSYLKKLTENMEEGLIICDQEGNIKLMNQASKDFLGKNEEEKLENLVEDKSFSLSIREIRVSKRPKNLEHLVNSYQLKIIIDPIENDGSLGFILLIIDNSESKKAEIMRREFSANVSHELKSPLTSINGYAELIATGLAKNEDVKDFAQIIYEEGNRLLEIIDDIISLSGLDENREEIKKEEFDIKDIIDSSVLNLKNLAQEKNIEVINNVASYKIESSPSLFSNLFTNIYENAIKYTEDSGKITLTSLIMDKKLYILIKDTGIGISPKDQERIFERFYMVDKARKREKRSTGLGLSIAKHIADYLGFGLEVSSKLNEGSTFKISIDI